MAISPYSVIAASVVSGGTGYAAGDVLTVANGSAGVSETAAQVTVLSVASGVVTSVAPAVLGAYSVMPTSPVAMTGGGGSSCTLTPTWATLYALPADLQDRYGWDEIGDLIAQGEQASALDQVTVGTAANGILLQLLSDAGGDVEAALLASGRYANTDLFGLTGNAVSLLKRIICEITIAYIFERRPMYRSEMLEKYTKDKDWHLKRLQDGKNVFNLPLVIAAGLPEADGPTLVDYGTNFNLLPDRVRYFPPRALPYNR